MISESDLAELIFQHVLDIDDPIVFHQLAQVSRRFNSVSKRKLVKKESFHENGSKEGIWTELPDGREHGFFREWHNNGLIRLKKTYKKGVPHGNEYGWYSNCVLKYAIIYKEKNAYYHYQEWDTTGCLVSSYNRYKRCITD